jgi:hypothetical protein
VTKAEDWYNVSWTQIKRYGGSTLLQTYKLSDLISKLHPTQEWSSKSFDSVFKAQVPCDVEVSD